MTDEILDRHRDAILSAASSGGAAAVIGYIDGVDDPIAVYARVRRLLAMDEHADLDTYAAVAEAGVRSALADGATRPAAAMAYNLAADLADCWPGDDLPRTARHHEAGVLAAERCIRIREDLGLDAAMAWWAKGVHELALGREGAEGSLTRAVELSAAGSFDRALYEGYRALSRDDRDAYKRALDALRTSGADEDDVELGIGQLEKASRAGG